MKIVNCKACGNNARCTRFFDGGEFFVICNTDDCCTGPAKKTRDEAIQAWNKVMGEKEK